MNDIDYKAVIEIINNFLNNEKVEIFGISYGEEHQLRQAIENLLKERQADKDRIKQLEVALEEVEELLEDSIPKSLVKEKIKFHENARDLAGEELTTTQVLADSDSLNFGRIQAHNVAISKLQELLGEEQ